ncbi:hydroxyacylglutathione hydrolase [Sansalvadorimonas sp. 2012CJ34-2]|uniref:Hydroxyacylglutathione hydrolase n=1 Tax=Parendozoicomonas callyspongiae TaxID=2942213 RepID=A0ABT0PEN4_9GAMM|nr:hydroxyacylglutathione hydrolase [Sansalvadorimonas sp. 2012CJ34-2]MCL6269838.1 hydroxyacylglutathione hydrolase [Sansalvadorimonas sp. 2012CJ34-2]
MISITGLPAFNDNYIWMLVDSKSQSCFVVDPGDGEVVLRACQEQGLTLKGILLTHHHADHTGGVARLTSLDDISVYGPAKESIKGITQKLSEGDIITILGHDLAIFDTPGHTAGHISYFGHWQDHEPVLFCGDTLFAGGCGRLFEGTPAQMRESLTKLSNLPDNTLVYCAHEYTQANLNFARAVEPENTDLQERYQQVLTLREQSRPTVPSRIVDERKTNPFLRADVELVRKAAEIQSGQTLSSADETFAAVRRWKDTF